MSESPVRSAATADLTLHLPDKTTQDARVVAFEGFEGLSELFSYNVQFVSDDGELAPSAFLGKMAVLEIAGPRGARYVHGLVNRFTRHGQRQKYYHYSIHITASQWLLTKRRRCRIFQSHCCSDMTAPGIIKQVMADAGFQTSSYRLSLATTYPAREYCVQYRETEFEFISRLMEEEGIYYFFEHGAGGHVMVIADGPVSHVACPNYEEVVYREPTGLIPERDILNRADEAAEVRAGATRLKDFDFVRPPVSLMKNKAGETLAALEIYDYPGNFLVEAEGQRLVDTRLEEEQWRAKVYSFGGDPRGLIPGYKLTLAEHPTSAMNADYLIVRQSIRATQPQSSEAEREGGVGGSFQADVLAIPADVHFRAERVTPRPLIAGAQTALVVGPSGEEIYTDKYGRVKVQFHWDIEGVYDEKSSCWIRVSQGMAGGQYGAMFLPRVGQEVIVSFLEGDPDRPLITGRVYNNDLMPPYTLPDEKTKSVIKTHSSKSGGGTNEICFEDLKDSEKILIYAQKDFHLRVNHDRVENVTNDRHLTVEKNKTELVKQNSDRKVEGALKDEIVGDVSLKIGGKRSDKVAGTLSVTCDSDVVEKFGANHKHEVTTTYVAKAQKVQIDAASGIELKVGGNSIVISSSGISLKAGGSSIVLTSSAIFIKGAPMVQINTAPGPPGAPVGPVTASATSPEAPAAPIDADTATPGQDTVYNATAIELAAAALEALEAQPPEIEEPEPVELSWIEIELVDEADQPVPGERYELTLPDGKIRKGTLDANGLARVEGLPPGNCQISFPRLDLAAWERI